MAPTTACIAPATAACASFSRSWALTFPFTSQAPALSSLLRLGACRTRRANRASSAYLRLFGLARSSRGTCPLAEPACRDHPSAYGQALVASLEGDTGGNCTWRGRSFPAFSFCLCRSRLGLQFLRLAARWIVAVNDLDRHGAADHQPQIIKRDAPFSLAAERALHNRTAALAPFRLAKVTLHEFKRDQ